MPVSSHMRRRVEGSIPEVFRSRDGSSSGAPSEDTAWVRYAANGEPVLSGMASLLVHAVVLALILTGLVAMLHQAPPPPEIGIIISGGQDDQEGGGSGNRVANGLQPGATPQRDETRPLEPTTPSKPDTALPKVDLPIRPASESVIKDNELGAAIESKLRGKPELANLGPALRDAMSRLAGAGIHGPGDWNGAGNKPGDGVGNSHGPYWKKDSLRPKRIERWEIVFSTNDARHYLEQLDALGAVIAVPDRQGRLMVIRDLKERPARLELRDVVAMNRIFWIDSRPESVQTVAAELHLDPTPSSLVAFFPQSLEAELVAREKAHMNRREEDIEFTRFAITFRGGKHVIRVLDQQPKAGRK